MVQAGSISGDVYIGSPRAVVPRPRQLPPSPRWFVGRHKELATLTNAMSIAGENTRIVVIAAIAGNGGIGKTCLALQWAHQNVDLFPDGQLFSDLHGFSPEGSPVSAAVVLNGFLDSLGVEPDRIPADLPAKSSLFRTLMSTRRILVLLDNAVSTTQVLPLLPGSATCTVLVTSRNHLSGLLTGSGAEHVPIDVLEPGDARALLASRIGLDRVEAEPAALTELLESCAGLPLALSIVAGLALTDGDVSLAVLAAELQEARLDALDSEDPFGSLRAVLSWSYTALADDQARLFALLGIVPGPNVGIDAASSLCGLPVARTRTLLQQLERLSLVSRNTQGRYMMHDLTRHYAAERADQDWSADDREAALSRLVDFYVHSAQAAVGILAPARYLQQLAPPLEGSQIYRPAEPAAAMAWYESEFSCLTAIQAAAAAHGWDDRLWQLAWNLAALHFRRGRLDDHLAVCETGLAAAERLGDRAAQAWACVTLGDALGLVGRYTEALRRLQQALDVSEQTGDIECQAYLHESFSWTWQIQGKGQLALEHAARALELFQRMENPKKKADSLENVAWHAARLGQHDYARACCESALLLHRQYLNREGEAHTLCAMGYIANQTSDCGGALDYYLQAQALFSHLGNVCIEANALDGIGQAYAGMGRLQEAAEAWKRALELFESQGREADIQHVRNQLTRLTDGEHDRAAD